jgi:replication-associated recombination protein RarA
MKELDYGKKMQIDDPERPPAVPLQEYLPQSLKEHHYYQPGHQGKETSIKTWLQKRRGKQV